MSLSSWVSGLLYVAMIFIAAGIAGALIGFLATDLDRLTISGAYALARQEVYRIMNIFSTRMAAVFMTSRPGLFLGG
ncbi:MAG: hypothetical protein WBX22_25890 [Silvibacterium sp.]